MEKINHAPVRDVSYEASVENIIAKIKNLPELDSDEKHLTTNALEKQIRKRLDKIEENNIIRYRCPTCGEMYWMKSMLSCENCGQLLIYGREDNL